MTLADSFQFRSNAQLRAEWQASGDLYMLNPGTMTTWSGYRLLGKYCPGSNILPPEIAYGGKSYSIIQLIASDNWGEDVQCGLQCNIQRDVQLSIPSCGDYLLKYDRYRYVHFQTAAECTEVFNFFKTRQNTAIPIYLRVL